MIVDLFEKDINRSINGVIKVGQLEDSITKTELEEYVLTPEIRKEFTRFFSHYVDGQSGTSSTGSIGIWISGFFGSGKSHFLKMLSYLLSNRVVANKAAFEWFRGQIKDASLEANIGRAGHPAAEVMLFNIDAESASDGKQSKSAILQVLQKVFDTHRGYFGADPSIAKFERLLEEKNQLQTFKAAFERIAGQSWIQGREEWGFSTDAISKALEQCGYSPTEAQGILAERERFIANSPKEFALEVKKYLESRPNIRVVFMIDEVGQYIGSNTDLMLNLQTVVEELGSHNAGRAWVMVTSQEDLDSLIGVEDTNNRKRNDFSKIQGRFEKPISLSSKNADEVIQLRLLEKTPLAKQELTQLYQNSETILGNLIRFDVPMHLPSYKDATEFVKAYPFVGYQFVLLQEVFTKARQMGASGKHLASGERSMLDGFKLASVALQHQPVGSLAPFYLFYEAISGFLEGAIKRVIERASENPNLKTEDTNLLKTLFMMKYLNPSLGKLENLTTLSVTSMTEDRIALKKQVEESLARLEGQTLISRNADVYSFLTDDEQDVGRQIKNTNFEPGSDDARLQELIWENVYTEKKFKPDRRHEFGFNRALDGKPFGNAKEQLILNVIPADSDWHTKAQHALTGTGGSTFEALIVLPPENTTVLFEVRTLVQTEQFLRSVNTGSVSAQFKSVIDTKRNENSERQKRLLDLLEDALRKAQVIVSGRTVNHAGESSKAPFKAALEALVEDNFTKFKLVQSAFESDAQVDTALQKSLLESPNAAARDEIKTWLDRKTLLTDRVVIRELIEAFARAPYGWSELDVLGVSAELLALGELELRHAQNEVTLEGGLTSKIRSKTGLDSYALRIPKTVNPASLNAARALAREALGNAAPPSDPKELATDLRAKLNEKQTKARTLLEKARDGLPFVKALEQILDTLREGLLGSDTASLLDNIAKNRDTLEDKLSDLGRIERFFENQLIAFKAAKSQVQDLENDLANLSDTNAKTAVQSAKNILNSSDPSKDLPRIKGILEPAVNAVNLARETLRSETINRITQATTDLSAIPVDTTPLENLKNEVQSLERLDAILARQSRVDGISNQIRNEYMKSTTPDTMPQKTTTIRVRRSIHNKTELEAYLKELEAKIGAALLEGAVVNLE